MEKRDDIKNFYITRDFQETWKLFIEICNREGKSYSEKLRALVQDYALKHAPGNPQQTLKYLFENGKIYVEPETKFRLCSNSRLDVSHGSDFPMPFCKSLFVGLNYQRCVNCVKFKKRV